MICVGTPSKNTGDLDLTFIARVCEDIGKAIARKETRHVVVTRSTMLPGSMSGTVIPTLEKASGKRAGEGFGIAINPRFGVNDGFKYPGEFKVDVRVMKK